MITLKQARKNAGLNQADVAKKLGISAPSSSKYETGQSAIPNHKLLMLCELYGVETVDLKLHRVGEKIFAIPHQPTPFIEIAQNTGELDDRVCLYYVIERVGDCIEHIETTVEDCNPLTEELYEFERELVHALGANQLERRNNG